MNFYFNGKNEEKKEKAYDEDVLEGNWFEDRCTSEYDNKKKKDYMLLHLLLLQVLLLELF